MHTLFSVKRRKGITLLELMIAISILGTIIGMVSRWFYINNNYQKRLTKQTDSDNTIRKVLWEMHKDLRVARSILYPRKFDKSKIDICSDNRVVVRNFEGDIISYYYDKETKELTRQLTCIQTGANIPENSSRVIGKDIDSIVFTNRNVFNNQLSIYIESGPSVMIDSVFLMND